MVPSERWPAVTGVGLLCGLGLDLPSSWEGALSGSSPAARFSLFDPAGLSSPFGFQLPGDPEPLFKRRIKKRRRDQMTRGTMIAVAAAAEALERSGLDLSAVDRDRVGVVIGATGTGYTPPPGGRDPHRILRNMANAPASWVALTHKLGGPSFTVSTACSSGIYALASACWLLDSGQCDVVLAGAADSSLNAADVEGFGELMALSESDDPSTASRPFDRRRDGFVMGEGGGMLVLERPELAAARDARIIARLPPPALTGEAYNIISPRPAGEGMARTMGEALRLAHMSPSDVDYLNAHGTSTQLNDRYETEAIHAVFGEHAARLPVSSTKGMTGHCLAGAAGVEAALCCAALDAQVIPPTVNLTDPDPELTLDFVPQRPRPAHLSAIMCNAFAFGGHNGVCLLVRDPGSDR